MTDSTGPGDRHIEELIERLPEMPADAPVTYIYLWQLETWLRQMVYVELKSELGKAWAAATQLPQAQKSMQSDMDLTHMPGPERQVLSFSSLSELSKIIEARWDLFGSYLPPKNIWLAKLSEVEQVRHRVAHYRYGNSADAARVASFLRDVDHGFWHFCTSYNETWPVLPPERDPVSFAVAERVGGVPYALVEDGKWAMVTPPRELGTITTTVEVNRRPWAQKTGPPFCGKEGYLYSLTIIAYRRCFDYRPILERAERYEDDILHILLDSLEGIIRFTLPAVLGQQRLEEVVGDLITIAFQNTRHRDHYDTDYDRTPEIQRFANSQPEYVLGPSNPLTFLSSDMPARFFAL